jgi:GMP synthase-like glutamine amidotransferase
VTPSENALPEGWVNVGASSLCGVQGLYRPGKVLTYQGHPEFDAFLNAEGVKALGVSKTLSSEQVQESLRMIDRQDDSILHGEVFFDFISGSTLSS